jgi:hypothetical protein
VVPIAAPFFGLLDTLAVPVSVILSSVAIAMGIAGVRRFWIADHGARWSYTGFIAVVIVMLSVAIAIDVSTIVTA